MINPISLAAYSSELLSSSADSELEQRLGLYQVFLKLYEHHQGLLEEILNLEHSNSGFPTKASPAYVQGMVNQQKVFLITNLIEGKSQAVYQSENTWTLGRGRQVALPISDKRLSRLHAVIRYVEHQGFYLIDLGSTNGSFVNGEQVRNQILLKDGDRVRLSSLTFTFFSCYTTRTAAPLTPEMSQRLQSVSDASTMLDDFVWEEEDSASAISASHSPLLSGPDETVQFLPH